MKGCGVMPKETIQDVAGTYDVRVGWAPDSVQVGIETAAGFSLLTMLYGDQETLERIATDVYCACMASKAPGGGGGLHGGEQARELGRSILDIIESSQISPGSDRGYNSIWATLTRSGLNRLIRVLRRARDSAYGRDE